MKNQFFVNHETRMCRVIGAEGDELAEHLAAAKAEGYVEVSQEQMYEFLAVNRKARESIQAAKTPATSPWVH